MIKVNLAPIEELENPYWFVPDTLVLIAVVFIGYFGLQFYLSNLENELTFLNGERDKARISISDLAQAVGEFDRLQVDIKNITAKKDALSAITVSQISRYRPIILLEHIQNLMPEGVWLYNLELPKDKNELLIQGQAFDNILIAEFISSLYFTRNQEVLANDIRTQVYFSNVELDRTAVVGGGRGVLPELAGYPEFTMKVIFAERPAAMGGTPTLSRSDLNKDKQALR